MLVHVDDMVAIGSTANANDELKTEMCSAWTISDLGNIGFCLGISVRRGRQTTHSDVSFTMSKLAQYLDCFHEVHWKAVLHTVRYLVCMRRLELSLGGSNPANLVGYSDLSWSDCLDTHRLTMG